ncbi:MAG: prephenate dehydratase [Armatimonadota bacterium]|nr:prephenate dehydratase [Armatimonadota bacterium]MDR5702186.1 prephenate dehydratase [Armatimonadota bacterium]MDR7433926.1 prephenate dehydratase [Armatimonadota bacterium]
MKVAFQGERGAYSEEAVALLFHDVDLLPCRTLREVFEATAAGSVDSGVVPVENSQAGSINETYDLLLRYDLFITGEVDVRVQHCLLGLPGETLESIKKVFSHPQALAQCEEFLRRLGAEMIPTYDTAGSAKMVAHEKLSGCAAVASRRAAMLYGLQVLASGIETNPDNYTKFLAIGREPAPYTPVSKTSLVFATRNVPGALYRALGVFATREINLTKLESRPSRRRPWEYIFYLDFEGHLQDSACREALEELKKYTTFLKILGSYPKVPSP